MYFYKRLLLILCSISASALIYSLCYKVVLDCRNVAPAVPQRSSFTGQLLIDVEFLANIENQDFEKNSVQIADFNWSSSSSPHSSGNTVIHRGVDDPAVDYFVFFVHEERFAVRKFEVASRKLKLLDDREICVPKNISNFLWEFERSKFIDCARIEMNRSPWTWREIPLTFVESAAKMRNLMVDFRITPIIFGGSLLGWYRECSIIAHTKDFDFALLSSEYKSEFLEELKKSREFELFWTLGKPSVNFEMSVYTGGKKIDLFLLYPLPHRRSSMGGFNLDTNELLTYVYPEVKDSEICTGDLLGRLVFVPCNALDVIKADSGDTWDVDIPSNEFIWYQTPKSILNVTKMSKEEAEDVVKCFAKDGCKY